jgi:hypothetical protein
MSELIPPGTRFVGLALPFPMVRGAPSHKRSEESALKADPSLRP